MPDARDDDRSDARLLALAGRDDVAAFAELYDRHVDAVLSWFYRRTGCAETAADLMAETFAAAFVSRKRFRDTGAPVRAWLFGIARNQLGHYIRHEKVADRHRRRLGVGPISFESADFERVEALSGMAAQRTAIAEALASLPPMQARAVELRIVDELPYIEVAARLGCSLGAARVNVTRGLARLSTLLEAP